MDASLSQYGPSEGTRDESLFSMEHMRTSQNLDQLEMLLMELTKRLSPAMNPEDRAEPDQTAAPHPVMAQTTEAMWVTANRLQVLSSRVQNILARLEI